MRDNRPQADQGVRIGDRVTSLGLGEVRFWLWVWDFPPVKVSPVLASGHWKVAQVVRYRATALELLGLVKLQGAPG
jgi:hypothetical protein